jgi:predicted dehydrogenase
MLRGTLFPYFRSKGNQVNTNRVLKVGIAGFGIVGRRRKAVIDARADMDVVAVCDRVFDRDGEVEGLRRYRDYRDLLKEDLDALFVCMTNDLASDVTIAGLEKGLHVFCEKPPGRDVSDIERVREAEARNPALKLMYGFNHRYHDSVKDALRIIQSGDLGKIINMRGVYGKAQMITFNQSDWRTKRAVAGGGVLLDQGIHLVDLMRLFAGDFPRVHSIVSNTHWGFDVEDNAYALMQTADGVVAIFNSSATQWRHQFNLEITLEKGGLILSGILSSSKSYGSETLTVITVDSRNNNGAPREQRTLYSRDPSWEDEIRDFAAAILAGKPLEHGSSSDALETMKLVYRIYYSDPTWRQAYNIPDPDRK